MTPADIQRAREVIGEVRAHLKQRALATRDQYAIDRLRSLLARLKVGDHYIAEKCGQIEDLAGEFYSERKHWRYRGGPPEISARIDDLLGRIENQLERREHAAQS